jgi:hypothetical protein
MTTIILLMNATLYNFRKNMLFLHRNFSLGMLFTAKTILRLKVILFQAKNILARIVDCGDILCYTQKVVNPSPMQNSPNWSS